MTKIERRKIMSKQKKTSTPELDKLYEEITELEWKLIDNMETMINAKWNAPTLKKNIEKNAKELDELNNKFSELYEKMEEENERL